MVRKRLELRKDKGCIRFLWECWKRRFVRDRIEDWNGLEVIKCKGQKRWMKGSVYGDKRGKSYGKIKLKGGYWVWGLMKKKRIRLGLKVISVCWSEMCGYWENRSDRRLEWERKVRISSENNEW